MALSSTPLSEKSPDRESHGPWITLDKLLSYCLRVIIVNIIGRFIVLHLGTEKSLSLIGAQKGLK